MLENLTVVIPSMGRPDFLLRASRYWRGVGCRTIIVDGSPTVNNALSATRADRWRLDEYYWLPEGTFSERIKEGVSRVETEYVALCADDDFLLPAALESCLEVLAKDPRVITATPYRAWFGPNEMSELALQFQDEYEEAVHPNAADRLLRLGGAYSDAYMYGVSRTAALRTAAEALVNVGPMQVYAIEEWILQATLAALGSLSVVPFLGRLYSWELDQNQNTTLPHHAEWLGSLASTDDRIHMHRAIATEVGIHSGLPALELVEALEGASQSRHANFMRTRTEEGFPKRAIWARGKLREALRPLPRPIRAAILNPIHGLLRYSSSSVPFSAARSWAKELSRLEARGLVKDSDVLSSLPMLVVSSDTRGFYHSARPNELTGCTGQSDSR